MTTHHHTQALQGNSPIQLDDIRAALMGEFHFNTSLTEEEQLRVRQKTQHIYDITQQGFDWFITLTFRYKKTDRDEAVLLGKKFFNSLSRDIYGKRSSKRIIHYSAIEQHKDGSYHIHAMIKQPSTDNSLSPMEIRELIKKNWYEVASTNVDMSSSGNDLERSWFRPIHAGEISKLARYITKDIYQHQDTVIYDLCCLSGRKVG